MSDQISSLLPIAAFAVIFWLLLVRPAQRRRKQVASMQSSLGIGDEVLLSSGFFATVFDLPDEPNGRVELELSEGVYVFVARGAITEILSSGADPDVDFVPEPEYAAEPEVVAEPVTEPEAAADDAAPDASDPKNPPSES